MTRDEFIEMLLENAEPDDLILIDGDAYSESLNYITEPSGVDRRSSDTVIVTVNHTALYAV